MSAPSTAILQTRAGGRLVVRYLVRPIAADELNVRLLSVIPARWEGQLCTGQPVRPTRDERISILRAIGAMEFEQRATAAEVSP